MAQVLGKKKVRYPTLPASKGVSFPPAKKKKTPSLSGDKRVRKVKKKAGLRKKS
jgi:hypothetical protein